MVLAMKPSTSAAPGPSGNGPSNFYGLRIPEHEEDLLKQLMVKLELNASQVLRKGLRRLAELEKVSSTHRTKRST
jgi:hypothetical protein